MSSTMRQTDGLALYRHARTYTYGGFTELVRTHGEEEQIDWDRAHGDASSLIKFLVIAALNPTEVFVLTPRLYSLLKRFGQMSPGDRDEFCGTFVPAGHTLTVEEILARRENAKVQEILARTKEAFLEQFDKPFAWPEICVGVTALYSCSPIKAEVAMSVA